VLASSFESLRPTGASIRRGTATVKPVNYSDTQAAIIFGRYEVLADRASCRELTALDPFCKTEIQRVSSQLQPKGAAPGDLRLTPEGGGRMVVRKDRVEIANSRYIPRSSF
jgi:hypothetical protein